jgi:hypothetical protein
MYKCVMTFISLCQYQEKPGGQSKYPSIFFSLKRSRQPSVHWKFAFRDWGDDVNLVYVACTRASRLLSIPPGVVSVMASFDKLHQWKQQQQHDQQASPSVQPFQMDGCQTPLVPASAQELYRQLVEPLREEWDMLQQHHDDQLLCDMLLWSDEPIAPSGGGVTGSNIDLTDEAFAKEMDSPPDNIAEENKKPAAALVFSTAQGTHGDQNESTVIISDNSPLIASSVTVVAVTPDTSSKQPPQPQQPPQQSRPVYEDDEIQEAAVAAAGADTQSNSNNAVQNYDQQPIVTPEKMKASSQK